MSLPSATTVVVFGWAVLAALSLFGASAPSPAAWLVDWTEWVARVVAIVVAARVLWSGASFLVGLGTKWGLEGSGGQAKRKDPIAR